MKVLVIGGTKYFGKRLVHRLAERGDQVTVFSRGTTDPGFEPRLAAKIERVTCDRRDAKALAKATAGREWDAVVDQIAMGADDAEGACAALDGRTPVYIATSSQSVYGPGAGLREKDFDPTGHSFAKRVGAKEDYSEAKRQLEAYFAQKGKFARMAWPRFPIVFGPDDYTRRLVMHVEKARSGEPVYVPNPEARLSLISSADAARALEWLIDGTAGGPINFASAEPLRLADLFDVIEKETGRPFPFAREADEKIWSPMGIQNDWFMNVEHAGRLGFRATELAAWLWPLVKELARAAG